MGFALKFICFALIFPPAIAFATPKSDVAVYVTQVRPYLDGSVFVHVDSTAFCDTAVFKISHDVVGRKEMYSAVLSALMASKKVILEAFTTTGCNGWGTELQSIYLQAN
ncbi:MAG: hypothetical protein KZQ93_05010 [Candidatus Thiodiazotropha sp. (ex Monitilora ramsayi)]|nr:hypothetical protein [Candidatus Thiodiazotropha sp. (ex Monitilora ramsayi)]